MTPTRIEPDSPFPELLLVRLIHASIPADPDPMRVALRVPLRAVVTSPTTGDVLIGKTKVSLASVLRAWQAGRSPEGIVQDFPELVRGDVYLCIGLFLAHRSAVQPFLDWDEAWQKKLKEHNSVAGDLRTLERALCDRFEPFRKPSRDYTVEVSAQTVTTVQCVATSESEAEAGCLEAVRGNLAGFRWTVEPFQAFQARVVNVSEPIGTYLSDGPGGSQITDTTPGGDHAQGS